LSNQTATTAEKTPLARSQTQNSAQTHGLPHSVYAAWRTALSVLRFYLLDNAHFLRIVHAEVRSLRGRICVLRDKKRAAGNQRPVVIVGLGPMFEALPNGHLLLCRETLSRNEGIETMASVTFGIAVSQKSNEALSAATSLSLPSVSFSS
jgi:hypothetical protein